MNISTLIYLVLIFSFQVQASHLCAEETDQKQECKKCMANSRLDQGTCKCLDGYISDNKVNKCYSCLPNCKKCKPFQLNQCEECFGENADHENQCICKKGYIYSSQMQTCINKNKDLNLEHLQYQIQSKEFESLKFDFCLPVEQYAQTNQLYKLKINNVTATLQLNFTELNNQSSIAYIKTNEKLIFEKILLQKIKSRPILRDFNETIFEINYIQGLSQIKENNQKQNLILMIEIKNVISNSYYFLLMKCGLQEKQSLEEQKILESHVNSVVDKYFTLFYQCPFNCKTCTFETTEKQSNVQCKQCINGMKLEKGKCFYENQPIKIKEIKQIQGSEQNTECDIQTYLKDEYCELCDIQNCEICENQDSCKKCNDKFEIKDGKCECQVKTDEQCDNRINQQKNCIYYNGNECLQCEYGYYLHQNECIKMLSNEYLLCIKQDQCYNCLNMEQIIQKSKFESNKQVCECQNGYFMNYRLLECNQCDSSCRTCIDRQIKCTSCNDGFYLQDHKCKKCPQTCLKCDSYDKCINCVDGYYLDKSQCKECKIMISDKNVCAKCQNDKICTQAIEGYYVDSQNMVNKCEIEYCKVCKDKQICERCDPNYFVEKGSCVQCQEGCISCERNNEQNQIKCFNCSPNYTLSDEDGNCKKCPQNCKQCATPNTCNECQEGFQLSQDTQLCECQNANEYFLNNKCQICVENCEECESKDKCKTCLTSYIVNNKGQCDKKKCKITKCELCQSDDSCEQCKDSIYFQEEKKCGCKGNCETCTLKDSKQQCTSCKSKYYLKENECVESHCEDESKDGKCKQCKIGYFINSINQCEECQTKNCKACINNICNICQQGYYLQDDICKKCTDPSCLICEYDQNDDQDQCKTCISGYSPKETKCYKENNLFPLLALVFIIALIYGAFYFKEQILSLCSNQSQGFVNSSDQDVELTNKQKTQTKQSRDDDFNILED
ncbi:unnamed protein product [Paramecium pentaurelia]|uniref:EGF-like domain-containing protein n=1 Tax=Paramecium pentaurelia TaxID=43138 RepID=A0A8S1VUI6_9CILI|nr:unnamed protein product [Paramecium pentaurelia]